MSMICAIIGPTYAYFKRGIRTTWTSERIPFTAPNSDAEFMVNVLLQTIIFMHAVTPQLSKNDLELNTQLL